jgi:hypothetical protein
MTQTAPETASEAQHIPIATFRPSITLEEWFLEQICAPEGVIDFSVRASHNTNGSPEGIVLTIHPDGVDGDTIDFLVSGNTTQCVTEQFLTMDSLDAMKVFRDKGQWFALVGDTIADGVVGIGASPGDAVANLTNQIRFGFVK